MTAALLDHLWQSTLFAGLIWLIMPLFRANSAAVRFWLWFAASVKFLVPLSIFTVAGRHLLTPIAPAVPAHILSAIQPVAIPFSAGKSVLAAPLHLMVFDLAVAAWVLGGVLVLTVWLLHWVRLRAQMRHATDLPLAAAVPVKATHSTLEPGLVGIWHPVILLPHGIAERLTPTEMDAVMAHELCHLRRRDNLLAAVHMLVEALFWFHPLVWWLGSRLVEEREQACDESVLAAGNQPLVYAEGILKVCRFYVQSPLACASGVSGAALETRVGAILRNRPANDVEAAKSALLISAAALSVALPLLAGGLGSGPVTQIASRVATAIAVQTAEIGLPAAPVQKARIVMRKPSPPRVGQPLAFVPPAVPSAILPDAAAMVPPAAQADSPPAPADISTAVQPSADESAAIVCRLPQPLPSSRFKGPQVCLPKSEWAQLRAQQKDISPDGRSIVAADAGPHRASGPQTCVGGPPTVGGASSGYQVIWGSICF